MSDFGSTPFAGNADTLHSWQPGINKIANLLTILADNMTDKTWDQPLPLTCSGAMTSTGDTVEWARYRTMEPIAKMCFIDIKVSNMTLGGVASTGIYIKLPLAPSVAQRTVLSGQGEGANIIGIIASATSSAESQYVIARRTDAAAWTLGATTTIRLTGWYDYS